MEVDFLLIGQGIAGTVLSYRLIKSGFKVMVLDLPEQNLSSRIAAGLYNPVTGRKMVKTWNADLLFPEIETLYSELEEVLGEKFLYSCGIYRPFLSIEEQNEWMGHSGEDKFKVFIGEIATTSKYKELEDQFGGVLLTHAGYLDVNTMLDAYTSYLMNINSIRLESFEEAFVQIQDDVIQYKDISANAIVYCNGLGSMKSKYFSYLPFAPVKGEILDIDQLFHPKEVINRGVFRITLPSGLLRVGSTYSWHDLEEGPTERAKNEILERLDNLMSIRQREVVNHKVGIRPATKDRRPFLGKHPKHDSVYIFNGFGAKGVSLIPYYSKMMVDLLIKKNEPHSDVNISRFFKYI
ncbi:NAD(P)/FAD-dependent oxidoreductase [Belliella kenyensis]|uniref:NAD(P)/FAD-dependent oxidoreductase n=1 Tax=Belliella kenyensis TaxID=1472724 RepID=A0ABV8ENA7_9BACT|nr:FAD-dependent oxidoreductase [Belliella kenyensis]MCH7400644.1 FAD-binding oxidoreductase [Belliella kenyensis]MDN3602069.1 FAD-dependent oxidoreductase [Belliella kenyensis]